MTQIVGNYITYGQAARIKSISYQIVVWAALLALMLPIIWVIIGTFSGLDALLAGNLSRILGSFTTQPLRDVFFASNFMVYYRNSLVVAAGVVVFTVVASTLAGYGLTRVQFRGKKWLARFILFGYMFPPLLLSIPMYQIWDQLGLLNSLLGLVFAESSVPLPFGIWTMWLFFQTVPIDYEESVWMAGGSRWHSFKDIALPQAAPGMVAVGIFAFQSSWNNYTYPKVLISQDSLRPLTTGLTQYAVQNFVFWNQVMAVVLTMVIPAFLMVYFLQKYLLEGYKATA
ncbi:MULTISPECIES: carbohydrate ABC transporter permease [Halolamina]|uniref:Multiple sugar transport system permease protein n=1 Tax=Halolamina pelagica TaxID=699431 RepID=A0A1I5TG70_9EURY|nr:MULTISPECIES: carbohydrate ABC transporter permease [Halolamina]NHX37334.1 carbohydrate ABC transporter permease [Halolamina sp. R1-12]SFP82025.1 multiple sugar transport system permease protein [Halolamina pelagica]